MPTHSLSASRPSTNAAPELLAQRSISSPLFRPAAPPSAKTAEPAVRPARAPAQRHHAGRARIVARMRAAAISEFGRLGFEGASLQGIARAAGLTKQQLLYYCGSKDELYAALLHEVVDGWRDAFVPDDDQARPPDEVLRNYVRRKVDHALDQGELSRIFTSEMLSGAQRMARYWPEMLESTRQKIALLARWMDEGRIRRRDPLLLLQQIWGMTQYYADYATQVRVMMGHELPRQIIADEIATTVLLACGLAPGAPMPGTGASRTGA